MIEINKNLENKINNLIKEFDVKKLDNEIKDLKNNQIKKLEEENNNLKTLINNEIKKLKDENKNNADKNGNDIKNIKEEFNKLK